MSEAERWETVHTVNDFFDAPRLGVADFSGAPHVYSCVFDPEADEWTSAYRLSPISEAGLAAMMEDWAIWSRWQFAFHADALTEHDRHPAMAGDRERYEQLRPLVAQHLNASDGFLAVPKFRGSQYPHMVEVCWTVRPNHA